MTYIITFLIIFASSGNANMDIPFETCHWTNESYTHRIVQENGSFPLVHLLVEETVEAEAPFFLRYMRAGEISDWLDSNNFIMDAFFLSGKKWIFSY